MSPRRVPVKGRPARNPAAARRAGRLPDEPRGLAASAPNPIVVLTAKGDVEYLNAAAEARFPDLAHRGRAHHLAANVLSAAGRLEPGRTLDREAVLGDRVYEERIVRTAGRFVVYLNDVTELKESKDHLRLIETTDLLTELANRSSFLDRLSRAVHSALRYKYPLALALCDVDGMGAINERYGQRVGDAVLRAVGRSLKTALRQEDVAGRWGGDEFAIFFPHTSAHDAIIGVDRIRRRLAGLEVRAGDTLMSGLAISVGLADLNPADSGEAALIEAATKSLREARDGGSRGRLQ